MKTIIHTSLALIGLLLATGCGEGSGVDTSKFIDELTPAELQQLCEWGEAEQGGAREVSCGENTTTSVKSAAECAADTDLPHCTVSNLEDCINSIGGDPCKILSTQECATYVQCSLSSE